MTGKMLIIAEKPSVAREIASALGGFSKVDGWLESPTAIVSSGIGHLVEIHVPEADTGGKDLSTLPVIPPSFALRPIERTKAQFTMLKKLLKRTDVDQVVNACDAGREGELIFRLIYELADCRKPMKRMWLQSMTKDAILEAYKTMRPGAEFNALSDAAKCRSEADWLIGINGSRGITKLRERQTQRYEMMNAGRVQTPTLAIIVNRELEIRNFVPKDFWEIHGTFGAQAGTYVGKWFNPADTTSKTKDEDGEESVGSRFFDKAKANAILAKCKGINPSSVTDKATITTSSPPKLFDLTTLQREANKKFKFSAQKTLDIAQALYEKHKATSYPRTDATALPEDYVQKAKDVIATFKTSTAYAAHAERVLTQGWIKPDKKIFDNSKISDHFAIIPTGTRPSSLDADESRIYEMIVQRFLAVFHPAAEYGLTTRVSVVSGESFKTTGKVLLKQGWLAVYGQQASNDKTPALCAVSKEEKVLTKSIVAKAMSTTPPKRMTENTLLSAMEGAGKLVDDDELREAMKERGLGTPATRAATIEGLLNKKNGKGGLKEPYITREGKEQYLVPTDKGLGLIDFLNNNGIEALTSPRMTGEWEQKLRQMEKGAYKRADFMKEIESMTRHIIGIIRTKAVGIAVPAQQMLQAPCPCCKDQVISGDRTFECKAACGFKFWRTIAGRNISDAEAEKLFTTRELKSLDGFISKAKKKFSAGVRLNDKNEGEFVFEDRAPAPGKDGSPGASEDVMLSVPCPKCKGSVMARAGAYPQFVCANGDFKLWRVIAGRPLSNDEAVELIREGSIPTMDGFTSSKTGNSFAAGLRLNGDRAEFVFEPRPSQAPARSV